jgi:NUMOD4 motif/HNH endonuclease
MTTWKDLHIDGLKGKYQISPQGNVRNTKTQKILKQQLNHKGYPVLRLGSKDNKMSILVHRYVLLTYQGKSSDSSKNQVNHIDGIKTNNNLDNLEWVTNRENSLHQRSLGLQKTLSGFQHPNATLTPTILGGIVECIKNGEYNQDIAIKFGLHKDVISSIRTGRTYSSVTGFTGKELVYKRKRPISNKVRSEVVEYLKQDVTYGRITRAADRYGIGRQSVRRILQEYSES